MTVRPSAPIRAADFSTSFGDKDPGHTPDPHELRNAWLTTKRLEEQLELANQPELRQIVLHVRGRLFVELLRVEGYAEVPTALEA
jgi:hypothetical protein